MAIQLNIIHKSEQVERMKLLKKELEEQCINEYNLWEGIYHSESVVRGINLAHKQIVEWAKENNLGEALIAEDDIKFCGKGAFDFYINNKPDDFDLYLAGVFLGEVDENNVTKKFTGMTLYMVNNRFYDEFLSTDEHEHIDIALAYKGVYKVCNPFVATQHNGLSSNSGRYENYNHIFENRKLYSG